MGRQYVVMVAMLNEPDRQVERWIQMEPQLLLAPSGFDGRVTFQRLQLRRTGLELHGSLSVLAY